MFAAAVPLSDSGNPPLMLFLAVFFEHRIFQIRLAASNNFLLWRFLSSEPPKGAGLVTLYASEGVEIPGTVNALSGFSLVFK